MRVQCRSEARDFGGVTKIVSFRKNCFVRGLCLVSLKLGSQLFSWTSFPLIRQRDQYHKQNRYVPPPIHGVSEKDIIILLINLTLRKRDQSVRVVFGSIVGWGFSDGHFAVCVKRQSPICMKRWSPIIDPGGGVSGRVRGKRTMQPHYHPARHGVATSIILNQRDVRFWWILG